MQFNQSSIACADISLGSTDGFSYGSLCYIYNYIDSIVLYDIYIYVV